MLFCVLNDAFAQSNLVMNPSFEDYYDTSYIGLGSFSVGWVNDWSDPNRGSSDLYVPHSGGELHTPPSAYNGYEYPHTGYCFAGLVFLDLAGSNFYEYIQGSFRNPLLAGQSYGIECYVSNADAYPNCINDLGFYFSPTKITYTGGGKLPFIPQYANPTSNPIDTRIGWQRITGSYTALGGEQFLSLGNFTPYALCHFSCGDTSPEQGNYLFVDDVAVYDTSKVDTISLCTNDSVQIDGIWRHNEGLYTELIGGLPIRFYIAPRPHSANLTIIEKPFLTGDSVRITLLQKGGIDSASGNVNFIWVSTNRTIDVPMYNIYGCDSTVRYVCGTNIGIGALSSSEANSFHIFPNPANDFLQIMFNKNDPNSYSISIIDITGKEIISQSISNAPIDVSLLTNGMYFVKLLNSKTGKLVGTEKFVKE